MRIDANVGVLKGLIGVRCLLLIDAWSHVALLPKQNPSRIQRLGTA